MYIVGDKGWEPSHTDTSKYFIHKFAQLVDAEEVITNRHYSTNGLILFEEIYQTATMSLKRWKSHHRLKNLLEECQNDKIPSSIVNDIIIEKHFRPAIKELEQWVIEGKKDFNYQLAGKIQSGSLIYTATIKEKYYELIKEELKKLDFTSKRFEPICKQVDLLLGLLVPQLVYDGYSLAFLQVAPKRLKKTHVSKIIDFLFSFFSNKEDREYTCFIPNTGGSIASDLSDLLNADLVDLPEGSFYGNEIPNIKEGLKFTVKGKDPYSSLTSAVTNVFRTISLNIQDVDTNLVNWDSPYYLNGSKNKYVLFDFKKSNDPLVPNPNFRANTLQRSLTKHDSFLDAVEIDVLKKIEEPLYFYNLARTVPSIENSYILLWTSLEALMGLRSEKSDIEIVQSNVARAIAMGAVGRRVNSFVDRLRLTVAKNRWKKGDYPHLGTETSNNICYWIEWLADSQYAQTSRDPYNYLKSDPLLCRNYCKINESWNKLGDLLSIIKDSNKSVEYQLERLYLTRNLIIHSAQFGKSGSYLWLHLEWYVGKLLSQTIQFLRYGYDIEKSDPRDLVFGNFQGQYQSTIDYLERHKDAPITLDRLKSSGIGSYPILCF
ncbi:hypothetical protein [Bacillus sp. SN10]|uniref:hypothetical protein n=1 Tax=Bacillus sp. SN10 TaxID=2056493 RepID=UPI000C330A5D|nr:hypothetical protein [Bacillus sp. SN10]PKJ52330.1 hypothetical protein CWE34_28560 [Bacillus sp. SN10]